MLCLVIKYGIKLLSKLGGLLYMQAGPDVLAAHVVPMVIRAFEDPDARMQEEVLKRTLTLTKHLDFTVSNHAPQ